MTKTRKGRRWLRRKHWDVPAVLAEGDSWFRFPFRDTIANHFAEQIDARLVNTAWFGDTAEQMTQPRKVAGFMSVVESRRWEAVLLSAGGNDIIPLIAQDCSRNRVITAAKRAAKRVGRLARSASDAAGCPVIINSYAPLVVTWPCQVGPFKFGPWITGTRNLCRANSCLRYFHDRVQDEIGSHRQKVAVIAPYPVHGVHWSDNIHLSSEGADYVTATRWIPAYHKLKEAHDG